MKNSEDMPKLGRIASRKCPYCGHSEIGYTTPDGSFHPLKPGTLITVTEPPEPLASETEDSLVIEAFLEEQESGGQEVFKPWVPDVLKGNQKLRMKYGVMVRESIAMKGPTGDEYRSAFLHKIEKLIEKEVYTPLPIILDRFFSAPYLASGNPRQVSLTMWRELEEVQKPVFVVIEWIETHSQESLLKMIYPEPVAELGDESVGDKDLEAELQSFALEQFLEML